MKQALHIFVKDTRRFWPEVLLSMATLGLAAYTSLTRWIQQPIRQNGTIGEFSVIAVWLGWVLLISRIIHAEPLVGDRQFWITRPYDWKQLLSAKALFLGVFLVAPLIVVHLVSALALHVNPLPVIPLWLLGLTEIAGMIFLPLVAISCVTSRLAASIITVLGILIALVLLFTIDPHNNDFGLLSVSTFSLSLALIGVSTAVVILQYRRRESRLSWIVLIAGLGLSWIVYIATPEKIMIDTRATYAKLESMPPVALTDVQAPFQLKPFIQPGVTLHKRRHNDKDIRVFIPFVFSGIGQGSAIHLETREATFDTADGFHWNLGKEHDFNPKNFPEGTSYREFRFEIPYEIYDRLKDRVTTLHIAFDYAELQQTGIVHANFPDKFTVIPGVGSCVPSPGAEMTCLTTEKDTPITRVTGEFTYSDCPAFQTAHRTLAGDLDPKHADNWIGNTGEWGTQGLGVIPTRSILVPIGADSDPSDPRPNHDAELCTGAPLVFTHYRIVRHLQTTFTVPELHLP